MCSPRFAHLLSGCDRHVCHDPSSVLPSPCPLLLEESPGGRVPRTGNGWCPALSFRIEINYSVDIELLFQKRSSSQVQNVVVFRWRWEERRVLDVSKLYQLSFQLAVLSLQGKDENQTLQKTPIQVKDNLLLNQNHVRKKAATASPLLSRCFSLFCIRVIDWSVSASLSFSSSSCSILPLQW